MKDYKISVELSRWDKFRIFMFTKFCKTLKHSVHQREFYRKKGNKHVHFYDNGNLSTYVCTNKRDNIHGIYLRLNKDGSTRDISYFKDNYRFGQQTDF